MVDAPSTASYLLANPYDIDLPNSRVLKANTATGLRVVDSGSSESLTIETMGNLSQLYSFDDTGYLSYDTATNKFFGRTFLPSSSVTPLSPSGVSSATSFTVIEGSTVQKLNFLTGGVLASTQKGLNFIGGGNVDIALRDDPINNRVDATFSLTGLNNGTVTSVGLSSPDNSISFSGSPIQTAGIINAVLPIQPRITPGQYINPEFIVNSAGLLTDVVEGNPGPTPGRGNIVNVDPSMSPYYVLDNDYLINITSLNIDMQMVIVLPRVTALMVKKEYIIKDSSFENTPTLYTQVIALGETAPSFSIKGVGSISSTGGDSMSDGDFNFSMDEPITLEFTDPIDSLIGELVFEEGHIDNKTYFNITIPGESLKVFGLSDFTNTWAII